MAEEIEYLFGTDDDELRRLGFQHQAWIRETAAGWDRGRFGPGGHVLDLGCGPGYAACDLALRLVDGSVTGIDVSERFAAHARRQAAARGLRNLSVQVQDAEALDLPADTFDGVYCRWVLTYLRNPQRAIASAARALKPGGRMVLQDYSNYEALQLAPEPPAFRPVIRVLADAWRASGGDPDVGARLPRLMADAGLRVVSVTPIQRVARPGELLWSWPRTFFRNYLPVLVESGALREEMRIAFEAAWDAAEADPGAYFATPPMVEVVAERP